MTARRTAIGLALAIAAAGAVRSWPSADVLGGPRVRLVGDGDAVYHLVRARRSAAEWPRVAWTDPGLDYPAGALIPWPPLFDELVATAAVLTPGGADPEHVARVAAVTPVVLALLTVPLLAALAAALLGGDGVLEALVASLLPAAVQYGWIGLSDHHVAELLLFTALLLAYHRAWAAPRVRIGWAAAAGAILALAFWNWPGSGLYLLVLSTHAAVNHVIQPEGAGPARRVSGALALAAGTAALALVPSIALLGPPGALRSLAIVSIGGLSVVLCAGVALGASLLAVASWRRATGRGPGIRVLEVAAAGAVVLASLALVPGISDGVGHGATALRAGNAWYRSITEFKPSLFSGIFPLHDEVIDLVAFYGLAPVMLPVGAWAVARRWARSLDARQALLFLATWCGLFLILALARMRFMLYLSAPLGIVAGLAIRRLSHAVSIRWSPWLALAGAAGVIAPAYLWTDRPAPAISPAVADAAAWTAAATPARPGADGVLAPWSMGHALRAAGRAVVASPFGTEVSRASLADEATFFSTAAADEAEAIAGRRRLGFVMARQPLTSVASVQDFRAETVPEALVHEERSVREGVTRSPAPGFSRSMMARLFYGDGMPPRGLDAAALGWARLLREELPPAPSGAPRVDQLKTFGVVAGAVLRVSGVAPGQRVAAAVQVRTNRQRLFVWRSSIAADERGATLRVPYATGRNGEVEASSCRVVAGEVVVEVFVPERAVAGGETLAVPLPPFTPRATRSAGK